MTPVRRFARASGVMVLLYAGSTALAFAVGVLLARLLGPAGYGLYALALTLATLVGMITEFGLPMLAMREVGTARSSGAWHRVRGLLWWSDRVIVALSLLLIAGTIGWLVLRPEGSGAASPALLLWAALLVPFAGIGKLRSYVLLALDHTFASQFPVMVLRPALFLAGCLALWALRGTLTPAAALAAQVLGAAAVLAVIGWLYRRRRPAALGSARPELAVRHWLAISVPMGLTEGLRLLQGQLALLLVGFLSSPAQAGLYRVADAVAQIAALVSSVVGTAATAMFSRLWAEHDRAGLERVAVLSAWAMTLGGLLLGLPVALFGAWLLPAVFGPHFGPALPVFVVLWGGIMASGLFGLTLTVANMSGQHVTTTRAFALIAALNLGLGLVLVPRFGAIGGAFATTLATFAGTAWCARRYHHLAGINPTLLNRRALGIAQEAMAGLRMSGRRGSR